MIGFTNGCFDLLHDGHKHLLAEARLRCDRLVVAIDSDENVRRLKGMGRPVWNQEKRLSALCLFLQSGYPFVFNGDNHLRVLIETLKPDIIFKGCDYEGKEVVGSDLASVILIPRLPGFSTTEIIERGGA